MFYLRSSLDCQLLSGSLLPCQREKRCSSHLSLLACHKLQSWTAMWIPKENCCWGISSDTGPVYIKSLASQTQGKIPPYLGRMANNNSASNLGGRGRRIKNWRLVRLCETLSHQANKQNKGLSLIKYYLVADTMVESRVLVIAVTCENRKWGKGEGLF